MKESDSRIGSYIESGYSPMPVFVDDQTYTQILDAIVVACLDVVFAHQGKVLLGKRAWHPQADWWIIGGRMRPGEELNATAARHAKRDLGLELDPVRFSFLTTFSTAWKTRRHSPAENGTHTTSIVMAIELSNEEVELIRFNEEYVELQWITPGKIIINDDFHPALHQCAQALS